MATSLRTTEEMTGDGCYFLISKLDFFLSFFLWFVRSFSLNLCVCVYPFICLHTINKQVPVASIRVSNLLELELQTVVSCLTLMLGPEPLASTRAVQLFTAKPSPQSPISEFLQFFIFGQRVCVNIGLNRWKIVENCALSATWGKGKENAIPAMRAI